MVDVAEARPQSLAPVGLCSLEHSSNLTLQCYKYMFVYSCKYLIQVYEIVYEEYNA